MVEQVTVDTRVNRQFVPVTQAAQLVYVLVAIVPTGATAAARMGLNFGFVLDQSGSMRGDKIEHLKQAVDAALARMSPEDLVSVTVFSDRAEVIAPIVPVSQYGVARDRVRRLKAGGGTQLSRGMSLGLREVYRKLDASRSNQLVLLTDGQTYGDEAQALRLAKEAGEHHIAVHALGLGSDWNEKLLDEIATLSGGSSDLVESPRDIASLFSEAVDRGSRSVVRNGRVTLRLISGVSPRQVWQVRPLIANLGYMPIGERDVQVELGDIEAVEGKAIVVELLIPPRPEGQYRVAQAEVTYDLPLQNQTGLKTRSDIVLHYTTDEGALRAYDAGIMNLVEQISAFKLQTRALQEARSGNVAGATQKLRAAATRLLDLGEAELAAAAGREADNLERTGEMSADGTKKLHYQTRKLTQRLPPDSGRSGDPTGS